MATQVHPGPGDRRQPSLLRTEAPAELRVVVADDSALMRRIISNALSRAGVLVVATAANGDDALSACERVQPDVLTLDLAMPGLDGLGVLRSLGRDGRPATPVVVVSAFSPTQGARAVDALAEGAFDLVAKPAVGVSLDEFGRALVDKISTAAASQSNLTAAAVGRAGGQRPRLRGIKLRKVVVIATSTGGPRALAEVVPQLPVPLGAGAVIVQHMPPGFTRSLAARLDRSSALSVREAQDGESLDAQVALMAPGGRHLRIGEDRRIRLTEDPEVGGLRPRADLTIRDAARVFGERLLLVVLTGMGQDGLSGAEQVRAHGGRIMVEAQETCTVYGMPRAISEASLADCVLPLHRIAEAIAEEAA